MGSHKLISFLGILLGILRKSNRKKEKQIAGIEPVSPAWEASVLPMNYICLDKKYYNINRNN